MYMAYVSIDICVLGSIGLERTLHMAIIVVP